MGHPYAERVVPGPRQVLDREHMLEKEHRMRIVWRRSNTAGSMVEGKSAKEWRKLIEATARLNKSEPREKVMKGKK
jgi:hypothetical protein